MTTIRPGSGASETVLMSILAASGDAETEKMTILAASGGVQTVLMSKIAACEVRQGGNRAVGVSA